MGYATGVLAAVLATAGLTVSLAVAAERPPAAGTIQSALKTGSGSQAQKKQIQSWITLITAYITKA